MEINGVSVIILAGQDTSFLTPFLESLDLQFKQIKLPYEVCLLVSKNQQQQLENLSTLYPVKSYPVSGSHFKKQGLLKGLSKARYNVICTINEIRGFTAQNVAEMVKSVAIGKADIIIAQRNKAGVIQALFGPSHENQKLDIRSGLRVFRKEVSDRLYPRFSYFSFDLEFLTKAREAGYRVGIYPIEATNFPKKNSHSDSFLRLFWANLLVKFTRSEVIPFSLDVEKIKGRGFHYKGQEFIHHSQLQASQSAMHRFSGLQIFILIGFLSELIFFFIVNWHSAIILLVTMLTGLYFADLLFNLYLIYRSFFRPAEIAITKAEIDRIKTWPKYSILCPLYKEWQIIPQFVLAMSYLDYPKDKLQVMLLLEEDDEETIREVKKLDLPSYFQTVIVPDSKPKTKPKASNYGLIKTDGEYVVIYDAEDVPDPLQLKKAIIAFTRSGEETVCIQAKLNFYNPHQNLLTRVFTAEYSLWFDLILTGLQSINAPIPLGGTSNHFRKADLVRLSGWDSFNVTEDADLGMRLVKAGFKTAIINSVTLEEANSSLSNWFWQRSRWIKGYMQTYLIHMRNPNDFLPDRGRFHLLTFQLIIGGKILSMFINPVMWVITIGYFAMRGTIGPFIESFFPMPIFYMGIFSLVLGNFLYLYYYVIGCIKHGHDELVKYVFLVPFYWLAMSTAAWVAVYKLMTAPHHWSKTKHGLHLNNPPSPKRATAAARDELVDHKLTANLLIN